MRKLPTEQTTPQTDPRPATPDPTSASDRRSNGPLTLVRALSARYLYVLVAVSALVVVDQAIIQPQLTTLNFYAPAINVAGRQRMLSQNITKQVLALATRPDDPSAAARRTELQTALREWTTAHEGLLTGDAALGLKPLADAHIASALRALEPQLVAIRSAARQFQTAEHADPAVQPAALEIVLAEEASYLQGMENVVKQLETSARRRGDYLRLCGLAAMGAILLLLIGMYFAVLRPALRLIRRQIGNLAESEQQHRELAGLLAKSRDELEDRVERRTSELVAANRALELEIHERKAAEKHTQELSVQLAHASRVTALGQLATGLAHEINQPLASITNYADVLELSIETGALDGDEARSTLAQLKRSALRAGSIVRRMRNFMRPASGGGVPVDLNDLVREVCDLCRPQLEQAQVRLDCELSSKSTRVMAEPLEIQQVLVNLVQNAVQALTVCPRKQREVRIRTLVEACEVLVEVTDTGPGFADMASESAFAPFFSTKADGLGMGLAISRTIVERHQGRLWGRNRPSGGALVAFSLPSSPANERRADLPADCLCR